MNMNPPKSCDTFAVLPPGTEGNCVIFGKNSDRPSDEVQEVVYVPASDHPVPCKLKCTYIEIDQVPHTYATILSKPSWMWGAEMGANEYSVCIGNEAVWTKLNDDSDSVEKLLGMDLLRLGLERAKTALEALNVIVSLIDTYGMGGNCSDTLQDFTYHNSFLIADPEEVWILECAGTIWAAEKLTNGVRNISNELSIGTKIDLKCDNLEEFAKEKRFWNQSKGPLNFKCAFGLEEDEESYRYKCGKKLLLQFSKNGHFKETDMFNVLRDKRSGICMSSGSFVSTGSQVSVLRKPESGIPSCHWFTATPDPIHSVFKPFIFSEVVEFPPEVVSPVCEHGSGQRKRFDRSHVLYRMQEQFSIRPPIGADLWRSKIKEMEAKFIQTVKEITSNTNPKNNETGKLFKMAVEEEMNWYISNGISKPKDSVKT